MPAFVTLLHRSKYLDVNDVQFFATALMLTSVTMPQLLETTFVNDGQLLDKAWQFLAKASMPTSVALPLSMPTFVTFKDGQFWAKASTPTFVTSTTTPETLIRDLRVGQSGVGQSLITLGRGAHVRDLRVGLCDAGQSTTILGKGRDALIRDLRVGQGGVGQ